MKRNVSLFWLHENVKKTKAKLTYIRGSKTEFAKNRSKKKKRKKADCLHEAFFFKTRIAR